MKQPTRWSWSFLGSASGRSAWILVALLGLPFVSAQTEFPSSIALGPPTPPTRTVEGNNIIPRFALAPTSPADPSVKPSPVFAPMVFAVGGPDEPLILVRQAGKWSLRRLEALGDWHYVGVLGGGHIWAVLDTQWESSWNPITLIRSVDGGQSWSAMGQVPKPSNWTRFDGLRMDSQGSGRLTLVADVSSVGLDGEDALPGLYHYRTKDFGKTWSTPEFERNDLQPAVETAKHRNAAWDPSVHLHQLWQNYLVLARPESQAQFKGVTWSDKGSEIKVVLHTDLSLDAAWTHSSLKNPPRELLRIRGLEAGDSQEIPVKSQTLKAIRVGFHQEARSSVLHVVLDLSSPTVYIRSIKIVEGTNLEMVLAQR